MQSMTGLLLFMLLSRPKPNINEQDLRWVEDSADFGDLGGFFKDSNVKSLLVI